MIKHFCASNDLNGNPQRCYVLVDDSGQSLAVWDEGYKGSDSVPGVWRKEAYSALRSEITTKEYKRLLKTLPSPDYAHEVTGFSHLRSVEA